MEPLFEQTKLLDCCTAYFLDASKGFAGYPDTAKKTPWILRLFGYDR